MKILFVTMKYEHKNDMHINNILSFLEVAAVDYYGPGFQSREVLEKGVDWFWKENGGYDAIILDFALAILQIDFLDIREAYHWHRYALSDYKLHMAIYYADKIINELKKADVAKALFYWCDTYNIQARWERIIEDLIKEGFYFLGPGIEFFPEVKDEEYLKKVGASNRYRAFCMRNSKVLISMCHATVNYIDCCMTPSDEREYDITIPGNLDRFHYPERAQIEDIVKVSDLKVYDDYKNRTMGYLNTENGDCNRYKRQEDKELDQKLRSSCVYMDFRQTKESVLCWRENYHDALRRSKMGYACGAVSRQILRKFAEIPCAGALLLCEDIPPLANYGFVNGFHAVTVTPQNVLDTCEYFLHHVGDMRNIANNGRKMILQTHTALAHARFVVKALEAVNEKRFERSYWQDGQFIIE